jgi:hypothetical protein
MQQIKEDMLHETLNSGLKLGQSMLMHHLKTRISGKKCLSRGYCGTLIVEDTYRTQTDVLPTSLGNIIL